MTGIEMAAAVSESYLRARDLLAIEELVLAAIDPREADARGTQSVRVSALRKVTEMFAAKMVQPQSDALT